LGERRKSMQRIVGLLAVLTALGIPVERYARGVEPFPTPGLVLTLGLLFSAGVFLLVEASIRRPGHKRSCPHEQHFNAIVGARQKGGR